MVLASVVGAYYYLRVIWYMYFEEGEDQAVLQASTDTRVVLSLNAWPCSRSASCPAGSGRSAPPFSRPVSALGRTAASAANSVNFGP